jgi:hypothetical protein
MPIVNYPFAVGTAAVQVAFPSAGRDKYVYIQNADYDGETEIYVGDAGVTTANGIKVWRDQQMVFELNSDDSMYAICSAAGGAVRVFEVR